MNYRKKFLFSVGIIDGIALTVVNAYFLIQANESTMFIAIFMIPVVIVCFAGGFLIAGTIWRVGKYVGLIREE